MTNNEANQKGLPVNLLIAQRPCLVVGGGKVAWRKIQLLLDAGAQVTAVSPEVCDELADAIKEGRLTHTARRFLPEDIEGIVLVYAATSSRGINRQVLECCREANILCCCVDGNWNSSDFTTPAITRHNKLTVSVSSGGNDCRQSKMVKNSLARHLRMMESAHLVVVGTDHHHLSVEEREPYHLTGPRFERAGFMIMQLWGIHEFMVLNTCNRVEVIAVVSKETAENGILRHVMGFTHLKENKFYLKSGKEAFEHICLVMSGMLSQTPGENHITAQMKQALESARDRGWAGNMVQEWVSSALRVSKEIKKVVAPRLHSYEIEDLTLRYLEADKADLSQATVMVLGAGMIGKGLVKDSLPRVKHIIWCYHVNRPELPPGSEEQIELCSFNDLKNRITEADIILSATEAPGHLLHIAHAPFFNQERPVTIIDLGMPRNIDPELDDLSSDITVVDLDGLKYWYRRELTDMNELLSDSRTIIANHQDLYDRITNSFKGGNAPE